MGNPFLRSETHEAIQAVSMMSRWEYLLMDNVQVWERLVERAKKIVENDPDQVGVLIANAIELGRAKRDLENYHV